MNGQHISITRYQKTRYWAIWNEADLLAVTVYRKGAEAVLNFITNTNTKKENTNTMTKTKSAATAESSTTTATIIKATTAQGETVRIKLEATATMICSKLKGKWHTDSIYTQPMTELIAEGIFTIEDKKSQKAYDEFFGTTPAPAKTKKAKKSKAKSKAKKEEQVAPWLEDEPQMEAAAPQQDEDIEAIIWQEIAAARKAQAGGYMEAPVEASEEASELEINERVTDVEPTAEALAPRFEAEAAQPEAPQPEAPQPAKHKTCNIVLKGNDYAQAIPEGYVLAAGDRLMRSYKGDMVEVFVKAVGEYEWNGEIYPTLTHISWKAAGYQISGNTFFGLPIKPRKG